MASTSPSTAPEPLIFRPKPLLTRLQYALGLWAFKLVCAVMFLVQRVGNYRLLRQSLPTRTKAYSVRPTLRNRIFIPKAWQPGEKLPLYMDAHGSGFAVANAKTDDEFCHHLANEFKICIVSIEYSKSPLHPFPAALHDVTEIAKAVMADPDLPIDHDKIAIGGFSAGGNLSLAASQVDGVRGKIKGVLAIYPVVDFSRKYKGKYRKMEDGTPDMLANISKLLDWGYLSAGLDLCDPLLSPIYASRERLPAKVFLVGAEYDYLMEEAGAMAKLLTGDSIEPDGATSTNSWSKSGIKWWLVPGVQHGFLQMKSSGENEVQRQKACTDLYAEVGKWLHEEVYA